jgi:hypothetical protein
MCRGKDVASTFIIGLTYVKFLIHLAILDLKADKPGFY